MSMSARERPPPKCASVFMEASALFRVTSMACCSCAARAQRSTVTEQQQPGQPQHMATLHHTLHSSFAHLRGNRVVERLLDRAAEDVDDQVVQPRVPVCTPRSTERSRATRAQRKAQS